jgi:hypothetical protein
VLRATALDLSLISDDYKRTLEEFLEQHRPQELHSRLSSWFAFDDKYHSALFRDAEPRIHPEQANATKFLYEVSLANPNRHPMVVAEGVAKLLSQGKVELAIAAARDYWTPTRQWKFQEYLSPVLEASAQISWPEEPPLYAARITYEKDKERWAEFLRNLTDGT